MSKSIQLYLGGLFGGIIIVLLIYGLLSLGKKEEAMDNKTITHTSSVDFSLWKTFDNDLFIAKFPLEAKKETFNLTLPESDLTIKEDKITSEESGGMAYLIISDTYPVSLAGAGTENTLKDALGGMVNTSPNNKLVSSEIYKENDLLGLKFLIENSLENLSYKGRLILKEKTLYQIFTTYYPNEYNEEKYNYFQESFRLNNL